MKLIVKIILIAALCVAGLMFFPWYIIMAVPFVMNIIIKTNGTGAFFSGFVPVAMIWLVQAILIHTRTEGILTSKIASVLPLGGSAGAMIVLTALIGGLAAGLSGYTGNAFRNILISPNRKKKSRYGRPDYMYRS
jgi:hypothetical protein